MLANFFVPYNVLKIKAICKILIIFAIILLVKTNKSKEINMKKYILTIITGVMTLPLFAFNFNENDFMKKMLSEEIRRVN